MKIRTLGLLLLSLAAPAAVTLAQGGPASSDLTDVTCIFADGKGMRVQYDHSEKVTKRQPPEGKAWSPAGKPFLLFLDTSISVGNTTLPVGAYRLFAIPAKSSWSLVVNKDVAATANRDESQDIARESMPTGQLEDGKQIATIYLAHTAANQCNIRIVYGKTMAWGEFYEK